MILSAISLILCAQQVYVAAADVACNRQIQVGNGQSCRSISSSNGISLNDFVSCNPGVNCRSLVSGSNVCLSCSQPDARIKDCSSLYSSKTSDTCDSLASSKGLGVNDLMTCNPDIKCPNIGFGVNVCLSCGANKAPERLTAGVPDAGDVCDCDTERGKWILEKYLVCNYVTGAPPYQCQWVNTNPNGNTGGVVTTQTPVPTSTTTSTVVDPPIVTPSPTSTTTSTVIDPPPQPTSTVVDPPPQPTSTVVDPPPQPTNTIVDPPPQPTSTSTTVVNPPTSTPLPAGFVFSPYKDITVNMDWNLNVMYSAVLGQRRPLLQTLPQGMNAITLAFATGECGTENWAGVSANSLVQANLRNFSNAGLGYIISTGGANGGFSCSSPQKFIEFVQRYYTDRLIGIDFDIEAGQSPSVVQGLINGAIAAERIWPNLRFSFTIATFGGNGGPLLNEKGFMVMDLLKRSGWNNYYINLMTMNYGSATGLGNCVPGRDGRCDMGLSAVNAARRLNQDLGVPFNRIELCPMYGGNDVQDNVFLMKDIKTVTDYAKQVGLGGLHTWSYDRDVNGPVGQASAIHNSLGNSGPGPLGFTKAFISELSGIVVEPPVRPPPPPPQTEIDSTATTTSTTSTTINPPQPTNDALPNLGDACDCSQRGSRITEKGLICHHVSASPVSCGWVQG